MKQGIYRILSTPVVFAGLCLVLFVQQQAKPQRQQQPQHQNSPVPITAQPVRNDLRAAPTEEEKRQSQSEQSAPKSVRVLLPSKDFYDYILLGLNTVLATVGVGGLLLASENLKKIGQQTGQIKRQADLMEQEIGILKQSSAAALASAESAQKNIDLLVAKERAHLRAKLNAPRFDSVSASVTFRVLNYGTTNAIVNLAEAGAHLSAPDALWLDPFISTFPLPDLVGGEEQSDEFSLRVRASSAELSRIKDGSVNIHCFGTIRYRDIFLIETERETSFYLTWNMRRSEWERKGGEEYNKQT